MGKYKNNKQGEIEKKWMSFAQNEDDESITFATPLSWFYEQQRETLNDALVTVKTDVGAVYECEVIEALFELKSRNIAEYMRYREKFKKLNISKNIFEVIPVKVNRLRF